MRWTFLWLSLCVIGLERTHAVERSTQSQATPLKVVIGEFSLPPFAYIEGKTERGVLPDIYRELVDGTGYSVEFVELPRKRLSQFLLDGHVDMYCHSSPKWLPDPALRWSPALLRVRDLVLSRTPFTNLAEFEFGYRGKIGTVLGFQYQEIDPGKLKAQRYDAPNPATVLTRFVKGELGAAILSEAIVEYYADTEGFPRFPLYDNPLHCAYSPQLPEQLVEQFNLRIRELSQRQRFEQIYHRYVGQGRLALVTN